MNSHIVVLGTVCKEYNTVTVPKKGTDKKADCGQFSVSVGLGRKDSNGNELTSVYEIEVWDKFQQKQIQSLQKGEVVAIQGNLKIQKIDTNNGNQTKAVITTQNVQVIGTNQQNAGMANIVATGRLVRDVESKQFNNNTIVTFTIAANDPLSEDVNFIDVECWNRNMDVGKFIHKGSQVSVSGPLVYEQYSYVDKTTGEPKFGTTVKVVNPQVNFLDKRRSPAKTDNKQTVANEAVKKNDTKQNS